MRPTVTTFKPAGVPARELASVTLPLDELEALRLSDLEGHEHAAAAAAMRISRQTFGRLLGQGRRKVADALLNGKALVFEGGVVATCRRRRWVCAACGNTFEAEPGARPKGCPACGAAAAVRRLASEATTSPDGHDGAAGAPKRRQRQRRDRVVRQQRGRQRETT